MRATQVAHRAVGLAHVPAEPLRHQRDQRQHGEGDHRQPPVHRDEHDHDAEQREDVAEDRDHAGREHVVDARRRRSSPASSAGRPDCDRRTADRCAAGARRSACRMSNMIRCPVICSVHIWAYSRMNERDQDGEERDRNPIDPGQVAARDVAIDRQLHQVRLGQLQHRGADDRDERQRHLRLVGPQIPQQPAHQVGVVRLAEDFFFVEGQISSQLPANSFQLVQFSFSISYQLR